MTQVGRTNAQSEFKDVNLKTFSSALNNSVALGADSCDESPKLEGLLNAARTKLKEILKLLKVSNDFINRVGNFDNCVLPQDLEKLGAYQALNKASKKLLSDKLKEIRDLKDRLARCQASREQQPQEQEQPVPNDNKEFSISPAQPKPISTRLWEWAFGVPLLPQEQAIADEFARMHRESNMRVIDPALEGAKTGALAGVVAGTLVGGLILAPEITIPSLITLVPRLARAETQKNISFNTVIDGQTKEEYITLKGLGKAVKVGEKNFDRYDSRGPSLGSTGKLDVYKLEDGRQFFLALDKETFDASAYFSETEDASIAVLYVPVDDKGNLKDETPIGKQILPQSKKPKVDI